MKYFIFKLLLAGIFCLLAGTKIQAETINFKVDEYRFQQSFVYDTDFISATNSYGNSSNDVHYRFQINCPTVFLVHHAGSELSRTLMYLLKKEIGAADSEYREIHVSHDNSQLISNGKLLEELQQTFYPSPTELDSLKDDQTVICMFLEMGEYELVCEGESVESIPYNGKIQTSFYFQQAGDWREYPIDLGKHSCPFSYESSGHYGINNYTKLYVYRKIQIEVPMTLYVETSSNRPVSVLLYDEQENRIDMPFLGNHYEKTLEKGTYSICLSTHDTNIWIDTRITLTSFPGNCMSSPILLTQSENTGDLYFSQHLFLDQYTDNYRGRPTNDVFFALQLTDSIYAVVNVVPLFKGGMFMALQNSEQQEAEHYFSSNDEIIELRLPPGLHYLICEGVEENGPFYFSIRGKLPPREQKEEYIPSADMNYVRTITPRFSCSTSDTLYYLSKAVHNIRYYDHLGRPTQEIAYKASPDRQDQIVHHEYDGLGRDAREWSTVIQAEQTAGRYVSLDQVKSLSSEQYNDTAAFSFPVYEDSPLGRTVGNYGPGEEWQRNEHGKNTGYSLNTETDRCRHFIIQNTRETPHLSVDGYYPANELELVKTQDEDGHTGYVFTDKMGRDILTREIADGDTLDTYRVYDDYGNLCFVLTPAIDAHLVTIPQDMLDKYAYQYRYDYRNRSIGKKLPGCEWVETIYDGNNRAVFSQDGEQRKRGEWSFTVSDLLNRKVLTGVYHGMPERLVCENEYIYAVFTTDNTKGYYGYALHLPDGIAAEELKILKADYYDNYDYKKCNLGFDSSFDYILDAAYGERYEGEENGQHCKGLLTGSIVHVLGEEQVLRSSYYYDYDHNLIQTRSHTLEGKTMVNKAKFNFSGEPVSACEEYENSIKIERSYAYDHTGRLKAETHVVNGIDTVRFNLSYDKLGRMRRLSCCHEVESVATDYKYNIRDWITSIDNPSFYQTVHFTDGMGTPCYNGNISSTTWRTDSLTRGYRFTYDGFNRMKDALYGEGSNLAANPNRFNEQVTRYDKMGNIIGLKRSGQTSSEDFGLIDNLSFIYDGNRLKKVTDNAVSSAYGNGFDFKDGANKETEYEYDANGNLIKDLNKKITDIQYNCLNLPDRIEFEDGNSISYLYDANGVKLRTTHIIDGITTTTDYCGNVIYKNEMPDKLLTGYGYVSLNNNKYHYFIQDHQGNNRVVVDQEGKVEEVNNYYPFGGLMADSLTKIQPYKYNGKELDRKNGLDWYDYGARMYDAALGRFIAVDPLAEISSSVNSYTYCLNNPFNRIDPTGMISRYNWERQRYEDEQGNEVSWESVQQEYGIGGSRRDSNITPWRVGVEWLTGKGPRDRIFVDGDYFTELLKKHEHIEDVRSMIISAIKERKELNQSQAYKLSGLQGVGKYVKDYSTLMTLGTTGNLAVTYLGSYRLKWHLISLDRSTGTVVVKFVVYNSTTIESGTRPPVLGYTDFWKNNIGNRVNKFFESGPMSETTQTFQWIETLKF